MPRFDLMGLNRYLAMKLPPKRTGLPMTIWIVNDGGPHGLHIKVSLIHGSIGYWDDAVPVELLSHPKNVIGALSAVELLLICEWVELNRSVIVDYWKDKIDSYDVMERLKKIVEETEP